MRRALISLGALAVLYGIAAQIGSALLPRRIWMVAHYLDDVELLPTYASLWEEAVFLIQSGILPRSALVSTARVLEGLALGAAIGVPLGLSMARAARLEWLLDPWVTFFRFTPAIALLPLYALWFGLGELSKILLIATAVAVVTLLGAYQGARDVPRVYLEAARSLGASNRLILRKIVWPAALPQIFSSLRIALGLAWVTVVVAELIKATMPSLGYLLALAGAYPRVPTIAVGIVTIGLLVLVSDAAALGCYAAATRWMKRSPARG